MKTRDWMCLLQELQALAQAGSHYTKDPYDAERFQRIREIASELAAIKSGEDLSLVQKVFLAEEGYQTPKIDTRAVVILNDKILLVQERGGLWCLPGGWMDVGLSIAQNTKKEALEEAGAKVIPKRILALHKRDQRNYQSSMVDIVKIFVACEYEGGEFIANEETIDAQFFGLDEIPTLDTRKTTIDQIKMCFDGFNNKEWITEYD